jgi:chloramphenicol O-acetyltransferase type A
MANWPRKQHFDYFRAQDFPHFNVCANVDITHFYKVVKERELSFFQAFLYMVIDVHA